MGCSFTLSEEFIGDGNTCTLAGTMAEDPTCTRLVMSGTLSKLSADTDEYTFAKGALFERHPGMKSWPAGHDWEIMTLDVSEIWMIANYGGASIVPVADYFSS